MKTVLDVENVTKNFGSNAAVRDVSLSLGKGSVACLLGPSGSGKTTLLRSIAGFEPIHGGRIVLHGRTVSERGMTIPPEARKIGMSSILK